MKHSKKKMPLWTVALLCAALLLFGAGGIMSTGAEFTAYSEDFNAEFAMDHIGVQLIENGDPVNDDGDPKTMDGLLLYLNGNIQPGKVYEEKITAANESDFPMFVRLTVRKYWRDAEGKQTDLDPALIELKYGKEAYNTGAWQINEKESTTERSVYYLNTKLEKGKTADPLFDTIRVNGDIVKIKNVSEPDENGYITFEYEYDGYTIGLEADVQGIQTHNANDAIKSLWGISNVTADGDTLKVN